MKNKSKMEFHNRDFNADKAKQQIEIRELMTDICSKEERLDQQIRLFFLAQM